MRHDFPKRIIYDDIIYSLQKSGGISVYWRMLEDSVAVMKRLVYKRREQNIFYTPRENETASEQAVALERYRNVRIGEEKPFVFHSSYYRYCKDKAAVNITTVHDFTYELFRHDLKANVHKMQKKNAVLHSAGVICISENTKNDLYKYYPDYKGKVKVIYHGYNRKIFNCTGNENRSNNVLFVGARTAYKGFAFALSLLSALPALRLVIIGGGDLSEAETSLLDRLLPNRYEKRGFVSNEELAALYNDSFALFYPSEYEGFGFPVIEAQACGCPVICQRKSSIPEVSGDKCVYVDSGDVEKSVESVKTLFDNSRYADIQRAGLENVKRFSWEKCAAETMAFYEELILLAKKYKEV